MRVLIDTNVLISAALSANGTPYHFPYDIVNNNMHDVLKLYQSKGHSLSQDDYGSVSAGVTEENFATSRFSLPKVLTTRMPLIIS